MAQQLDPYKNFKFRILWDGRYVAGVSRVGALRRTTEVIKHAEGGNPSTSRKSPGRTEFEAVTLERGITQDSEFEKWANMVWTLNPGPDGDPQTQDFRRDLTIEVYSETGQLALVYRLRRCWVSEYQALPELDATGNAIAIEHIRIENEGWERDYSVGQSQLAPAEPAR